MEAEKSFGKQRKYTPAPTTISTDGPNQATRNQGNDCLKRRGFSTELRKPSRVTSRVTTTARAGKNMAPPTASCVSVAGSPTNAPVAIGYTTPNSYAHVKTNVTAKKTATLFISMPLLPSAWHPGRPPQGRARPADASLQW